MWHDGNEAPPAEHQLQEARDSCLLCWLLYQRAQSGAGQSGAQALSGKDRVKHSRGGTGLGGSLHNPSSATCELCDFRKVTELLCDSLCHRGLEHTGAGCQPSAAAAPTCYAVPEPAQLQVSEAQGQVPQILVFNV